MGITSLQLAQMVTGCVLGYAIFNVKLSGGVCHHTWENLYLAIFIFSINLYLFARYFYFAYIKRVREEQQDGGYHLVLVANNEKTDDQEKNGKEEITESELRKRSAKRFENEISAKSDRESKKRA